MPWNDLRWNLYAPIYDLCLRWLTRGIRRESLTALGLTNGQKVLVVACGTGLDFEFISVDIDFHAIDLSPGMLAYARRAAAKAGLPPDHVIEGDATALPFHANTFDAVVLHFILAVADQPDKVLSEAHRVLKPGGQVAVLDKGVKPGQSAGIIRKMLNMVTRPLATDITMDLAGLVGSAGFKDVEIRPALRGLFFRIRGRKRD